MATLTIKNVPEKLHKRLKESAAQHRRSINSEAILALKVCWWVSAWILVNFWRASMRDGKRMPRVISHRGILARSQE